MPIKITKTAIHEDGLPTEKTSVTVNPDELIILVVATPGWGKTTFFGDVPDSLMICFEEGHKFTSAHKIIIDCWDYKKGVKPAWIDSHKQHHMSFMQALDLIEESKRFKFITLDTLDSMVKHLLDFTYETHKVEHASEIGEYGKGWDIAQNTPFRRAINRLLKTGRGIGMTTHEEIQNRNFKKGTQSKKETTLPNGVWKYLFGQIDLILHGTFGKRIKGSKLRQRLVVSEGSEDILAKNRGGKIPPIYISDNGKQWEQFAGFFKNPATVDTEFKRYQKFYNEED